MFVTPRLGIDARHELLPLTFLCDLRDEQCPQSIHTVGKWQRKESNPGGFKGQCGAAKATDSLAGASASCRLLAEPAPVGRGMCASLCPSAHGGEDSEG